MGRRVCKKGKFHGVRVKDLKDHDRSILYCECCGGEYSANRGDYFMLPLDHTFTCCDEPMRLVRKRVVYEKA